MSRVQIKVDKLATDDTSPDWTREALETAVQSRADEGWTLRAVYGLHAQMDRETIDVAYLIFAREEKQ